MGSWDSVNSLFPIPFLQSPKRIHIYMWTLSRSLLPTLTLTALGLFAFHRLQRETVILRRWTTKISDSALICLKYRHFEGLKLRRLPLEVAVALFATRTVAYWVGEPMNMGLLFRDTLFNRKPLTRNTFVGKLVWAVMSHLVSSQYQQKSTSGALLEATQGANASK